MTIPAAAILAECERRSYLETQALPILALAIDEHWTAIPAGFFQQLDNQAHLTIDPWYNLAHLRGYPAPEWQDFKSLLYRHIRAAKDLYDGKAATVTTKDQVAQIIVGEAKARNHTRNDCLAEMSALYQESEWNETVWDATHVTYGVAQQDGSYPHRFEGAAAQVKAFFDKLDWWKNKPGASSDIWLNICWLQQAPNWDSAQYWWDHGRQAYLTEIKSRIATVTPYIDKYWPTTGGPAVPSNRPDFNEYEMWSPNNSGRNGRKVDLFLLHTQEGDGNADSLARFLQCNEVSYHYTISEDYNDHGVTVVDVVDTDSASWSVLSANPRSINLCFAGSRAAWSRADWLKQSRAIDVAAYIAVQDCKKYGIPLKVLAPPYTGATSTSSGISDHNYVTKVLKDGSHTDVGPNFPWDVLSAAVTKYASGAPVPAPQPGGQPAPAKTFPKDYTDRELLEYIADQLGPGYDAWGPDGDLGRNTAGQRRTFRAGFAAMML